MRFLALAILFLALFSDLAAQKKDFTRYVNPFVGTGGHGHTFPGATLPFGFVQLSPDTRIDNWDGSSGYHYSDSTIFGFSHTHLSGTGIPDYCDILFAPTLGKPAFTAQEGEKNVNGYASRFSHENERAEPGYYSVRLGDDDILAEMTATKRVGLHRYTFPASNEANIILDLKWRDKVLDSELKIVGDRRIEGYRRSSSWAKDQVVYFVAEFSKPFNSNQIAIGEDENIEKLFILADGTTGSGANKRNIKASFRFKTKQGEQILVKVALSPVSIEGARKNLEAELPGWDFEKVRNDAKAAWNKELSKIEVSGGTDAQMTNFYTALYHTMIAPNIFQDVDGKYLGLDKKVHTAPPDTNYTIFSLWDTFRATHPLYTIIDEKRTADFINTFIRQYEEGGKLPVWELAANETDTMIGYHAVSVIADAMAKGIKGFDYEKAFEAAKNSAELDIEGLDSYRKRGYISMEDEQESVSRTLEYAYNDYCLAVMAKILIEREKAKEKFPFLSRQPGHKISRLESDYGWHIYRALFYKNLFDKQTGFMRPKQNGNWISPFAPNEVTFHFTEGNSWVYSFFVPQDISGLIGLYGGEENFVRKLDELFTTDQKLTGREQADITGLIGQYAHGNEPSHHIAYLFNYAGQPWKTQKLVRRILDEFYKATPDGLIGNEDCGQMSAWYVLSALGFYEVNPGAPVYTFGTPVFKEAKIHLENGKTFVIKAEARGTPPLPGFIRSVKLNGKDHRKAFFTHDDLIGGGTLEFEMSERPNENWFTEFPVSKIEEDFPPVPVIEAKGNFEKETPVKISAPETVRDIYYTLDASQPDENSNLYKEPLMIDKTTIVKAISIDKKGRKSLPVEAKLIKMPHDWTVKILTKYNRQYTGGGPQGLIDGIRGTTNFASGEWQGYQPDDLVAVIDLKRETEIRKVGGGFLQDARPWIWMPTHIEFEVSMDGLNFTPVADIKTDIARDDMKPTIRDYTQEIAPVKARYVRVRAYNPGKIPDWHPGAGYDSFIFVDEIFIQ
ncbi:MAG: GH92 family glycosyl hydrolase [Pyrinomonadaceae bacterium]